MCQALLDIMEPEIRKIAGEAAKKAAEIAAKKTAEIVAKETTEKVSKETALKMLKSGKFSTAEIHEYVPSLSLEEIETLGIE